ncbi:hypothetical protein [Paenibacillus sabinae]|uniref:Uncharacterized protein n=1 Tax=Paenibacillus sabinae T27 TaxID=1268072 RepID=X4ZU87_9BACL|nr:hypothetical protein [Paenibacillus sabinae]AHV95888.1 hypothetical protein PSAB_04760 [Paenibacillus sabinae T27]
MNSVSSVFAGVDPMTGDNAIPNDEIRLGCRPFAEEIVLGEGSGDGAIELADTPGVPDHVRIHSRLQTLRALKALRASQAEKEQKKGGRSYVLS